MIRNALIALYIMLVLAFSAVTRADNQNSDSLSSKHLVGPVNPSNTVDPLPGSVGAGHNSMIKFSSFRD